MELEREKQTFSGVGSRGQFCLVQREQAPGALQGDLEAGLPSRGSGCLPWGQAWPPGVLPPGGDWWGRGGAGAGPAKRGEGVTVGLAAGVTGSRIPAPRPRPRPRRTVRVSTVTTLET